MLPWNDVFHLTADDDLDAHRAWLANAWRAVDMFSAPLVEELVERTTRPVDEFVWRMDPSRGWVNTFPHSHRNPAVLATVARVAGFDASRKRE